MLRNNEDSVQEGDPSNVFVRVRFVLLGFDPVQEANVRSKLVNSGGVDVGEFSPKCTHLIVDKIVYDDPKCVVARNHGKTVVTALWVDHSLDVGMPVDAKSVLYMPVKDFNGIPGAKSLYICLTGYQRQDRDDIMRMVGLMGGNFSKPLIANKVTHLICYKFEGEKYELAKKMRTIKLVNHRWLEDCLKAWEILPEIIYDKSGYDLETMEAEAKDSEEETEEDTHAKQFGKSVAGEPSDLPSGSGTSISKGSAVPFLEGKVPKGQQQSAASKGDVEGKRFLTSPFKDAQSDKVAAVHNASIHGPGKLTHPSLGAYSGGAIGNAVSFQFERVPNLSKASTTLAPNPVSTERTPDSYATKSSSHSYSRKTVGKPLDLNSSGLMSMHLQGSARGGLEQYKVKDEADTLVSKSEQPYSIIVSGETRSSRNEPALHLKEGSGTLPQKRKSSLSTASFRSATKVTADTKDSSTASVVATARAETSMASTPHSKSSTLRHADNSFDQIDFWNTIGEQSAHLPKAKPSCSNKSVKQGSSNTTVCSSDIRMLDIAAERTPETSGVGLKEIHLTTEPNAWDEKNRSEVHGGQMVEQQKEPHAVSISSLDSGMKSGNDVLSEHNQMKNEASPKPVRRKTVAKKSLGIKSQQDTTGSGAKKQKGSLCLDKRVSLNKYVAGLEDVEEEAVHGKNSVLDPERICSTPTEVMKKVDKTKLLHSDKEVNNAENMDDETEAPEEDTGIELEKVSHKEMMEPRNNADLSVENNFDAAEPPANETMKDIASTDKQTVTLQEDRTKFAIEVGNSKISEEENKGRKSNSIKSQKNSISALKYMKKVKKSNGVQLGKKNDDEKIEVTKADMVQSPVNKLKTTTVSTDRVEKSTEAVELVTKTGKTTGMGKDDEVECPTNKLKTTAISLDKTEQPMDAEKDDKTTSSRDTTKGRKKILSKRKKLSESTAKETDTAAADRVGGNLEKKPISEKADADLAKRPRLSASELNSKISSVDKAQETRDGEKGKSVEIQGSVKGKKQVSVKRKKDSGSVVKESNARCNDRVELAKEAIDEDIDLDKVKVLHHATKPKSKTMSKKKAEKSIDAEKENKPIENKSPITTLGKRLRAIASNKSNKKPTNTDNFTSGEDPDMMQSTGSTIAWSEPALFILSGHRLQRKEFQQVIRRLKGRSCRDSHHWSYQATHFIVPDPVRRTEKFFAAAASGRWILKSDYLAACNQAVKFLAEEPYEWFRNGLSEDGSINLEAPRKWRLLRERTGHGAFHGMRIVVYGECIAPPLDTLKRAVKAGDGTILATSPPYTRFLNSGIDFAVISPGMPQVDAWVQEFMRHEIPCVAADYLVEYVCKPGYSLEKHVLYKTHAWAEKSFANLLSRSEEIVEVSEIVNASKHLEDDNNTNEDISCQVCGSNGRGDVMLICGNETGTLGCGIGTHIDCCDPPLEAVPEADWFCPECSEIRVSSKPSKGTKKKPSSVKRK